jgi:anti-sigma B factor antagonist
MSYSVQENNGVVVLALHGKIMGGPEATEINDEINTLLDNQKSKVVIDLDKVEWMNSSGLGILISAVTLLKQNNGALRLIHVSDRIQKLLQISKLNTVFEICADLEEAKASF